LLLVTVIIAAIVLLIGVLWVLGFFQTGPEKVGLADSVELSPNDDQIVFSYYQDGIASLYTASADGNEVKLLAGMKDTSLLRPRYSPDGTKILFLAAPKRNENMQQALYVMDRNGENLKQVTPSDSLVTEAVFSPDSNRIYLLKAGVFKNYSPIASRRPHEYDIFLVDTDGNNLIKLTDKKEYLLSDLSVTADGKKLLYIHKTNNNLQPMCIASADGKEELSEIFPKGSFHTPDVYCAALSPDNQSVAFSSISASPERFFEYELYIMNLQTLESRQLTTLHSHVCSPVFFHKQGKIMFVQNINWPNNPPEYQIYTIDLDGNNLKMINITLPSKTT
jgi:TolB protein